MNKAITYGLYTGLGLIAYFLLMTVFGQEENIWLRLFNFFIIGFAVYKLFAGMFSGEGHQKSSYFDGLRSGIVLTVVSVLIFVIFLGLYVKFVDPSFIEVLENSKIWGNNLNISMAGFAILIEGLASGVVISFGWMQFFKSKLGG